MFGSLVGGGSGLGSSRGSEKQKAPGPEAQELRRVPGRALAYMRRRRVEVGDVTAAILPQLVGPLHHRRPLASISAS